MEFDSFARSEQELILKPSAGCAPQSSDETMASPSASVSFTHSLTDGQCKDLRVSTLLRPSTCLSLHLSIHSPIHPFTHYYFHNLFRYKNNYNIVLKSSIHLPTKTDGLPEFWQNSSFHCSHDQDQFDAIQTFYNETSSWPNI